MPIRALFVGVAELELRPGMALAGRRAPPAQRLDEVDIAAARRGLAELEQIMAAMVESAR